MQKLVLCLMGPTGSGKTRLAIELVQALPCDIISVDSAMVYRGLDIGTAKPSKAEQELAPHQLIDICDPSEVYSAGRFYADCQQEINRIHSAQRIPLLVGGTMLYFRAIQNGLSPLPPANSTIRQQLLQEAQEQGWQALHQRLSLLDPIAAGQISSNDSQRIQRALEIYALTGRARTECWEKDSKIPFPYDFINLSLIPEDRDLLHNMLEKRFKQMLLAGFIDEVAALRARGDLQADLPAIRSVGYRQVWQYLENQLKAEEMSAQAIIATRQLAKRQLTWLRTWPDMTHFNCFTPQLFAQVLEFLKDKTQC